MLKKIFKSIKKASWGELILGAIIGMVLSFLFSSVLLPFVVPPLVNSGTPGFDEPDLKVDVEYEPRDYQSGQEIPEFGGLTWQENFQVYSVVIQNPSRTDVSQIFVEPRIPGCVRTYKTYNSAFVDEPVINFQAGPLLSQNPDYTAKAWDCSPELLQPELPAQESVRIDFVMSSEFDKCDILNDPAFFPVNYYSFEWSKFGIELSPSYVIRAQYDVEGHYINKDNITRIPTESGGAFYIYGFSDQNPQNVLDECTV